MQAVYIQSFTHFLSFFHTLFLSQSCYRSNLKNGNVSENVTKRSLERNGSIITRKIALSHSFTFVFISRGYKEDETSNSNFPNHFLPLDLSINSIYINFYQRKIGMIRLDFEFDSYFDRYSLEWNRSYRKIARLRFYPLFFDIFHRLRSRIT